MVTPNKLDREKTSINHTLEFEVNIAGCTYIADRKHPTNAAPTVLSVDAVIIGDCL